MDSLWLIDLSNNRLHCDCRMRWIKAGHYNFDKKSFTFECSYPSSNSDRDLLALSNEDLICGNHHTVKTLFILLICSVLFVGFSLSGFFIIRNRRRRKKLKRAAAEDDSGGDYTAVYIRDDDDQATVSLPDDKHLLENDKNVECDV
ncbi:uncharacterized protein LOC132722656 [Ruditapes philippinarum]|uniref:uncharacterized protein LOC132722656 n=1 Tax=Ruditapes philippinarum TaxID=129788 RepID=UPI00295C25F7|nr:uncharacterized protein LOC132722656 [Ruditapes philippinarum]